MASARRPRWRRYKDGAVRAPVLIRAYVAKEAVDWAVEHGVGAGGKPGKGFGLKK